MPVETIRFEDFELDRRAYELRCGGSIVHLERIPFDLLNLLVERRGELVTRKEILEQIWGKDVFVDGDNGINTAVRKIRLALKEDQRIRDFCGRCQGRATVLLPNLRRRKHWTRRRKAGRDCPERRICCCESNGRCGYWPAPQRRC